jgi:hypothetical protein
MKMIFPRRSTWKSGHGELDALADTHARQVLLETLASTHTREMSMILKTLASVPTVAPMVAFRSMTTSLSVR